MVEAVEELGLLDLDGDISFTDNDLNIILAYIDNSLEIVVTEKEIEEEKGDLQDDFILDEIPAITFVDEEQIGTVSVHEESEVQLTFVKDPERTVVDESRIQQQRERVCYVCTKCTKSYKIKSIYTKHTDICQGYVPQKKTTRKRKPKQGKNRQIIIT